MGAATLPKSCADFYPRSPCGERPFQPIQYSIHKIFLSTLSLRRATVALHPPPRRCFDFYPRSPCGERHCIAVNIGQCGKFLSTLSLRRATACQTILRCQALISIHALLAESDTVKCTLEQKSLNFYPRSPCGERQSVINSIMQRNNFYPRSPCGERHNVSARDIPIK